MTLRDNDAGPNIGELSPLRTRRLWSLWHLMRAFRAMTIMRLVTLNRRYPYRYHDYFFSDILVAIPSFGLFGWRKRYAGPTRVSEKDRVKLGKIYEEVRTFCEEHELSASEATMRHMLMFLKDPDCTYGTLYRLGNEVRDRFRDETSGRTFFALSLEETKYFTKSRAGWEEIIEKFPDAAMDIEEARKCFALSRYAAAVFHSVQVVELGLIELGKIVGVNDPLSGWTATTQALKRIIDTKHGDRTAFQQQHFAFLEQIHGTIEGLKNAWRNKVSHAQGKLTLLTADFSPDVAEEILFATRAFMRRLATEAPSSEAQPS